METRTDAPLLEVKDLSVSFQMYESTLEKQELKVISNLSITVNRGEILAIAGSSGSGKACWLMQYWGFCQKMPRYRE